MRPPSGVRRGRSPRRREGRWRELLGAGQHILDARRWRVGRPLARRLTRAAARRLTKVRRFAVEPGLSVAFLGPDGTGKSSMAAYLQETFFFPTRPVYMGLYGGGQVRRRSPQRSLRAPGPHLGVSPSAVAQVRRCRLPSSAGTARGLRPLRVRRAPAGQHERAREHAAAPLGARPHGAATRSRRHPGRSRAVCSTPESRSTTRRSSSRSARRTSH